MAKKGITKGRTRITAIPGTRVYYKPSLGKVVFRPTNVIRSSDKVIAHNEKLEALRDSPDHPVTQCKGVRPWPKFIACLKKTMKAKVGKT
jgi:DNA polymerase III epsilon subunit-like protein